MVLAILLYIQLGYYGQFMIRQYRLKQAAKAAWLSSLPDDQLARISLDELNTGGKWEEINKECWFHDHLYDVIRQKVVDGKTWLFCLDDKQERELIRQSGAVTRATQDGPAKKETHCFLLKIGDILQEKRQQVVPHTALSFQYAFPVTEDTLPYCFTEIPAPPPKA